MYQSWVQGTGYQLSADGCWLGTIEWSNLRQLDGVIIDIKYMLFTFTFAKEWYNDDLTEDYSNRLSTGLG